MKELVIGIVAAIASVGAILEIRRRNTRRKRFRDRTPLEIDDIFSKYYQSVLEDVERFKWVWGKVGKIIRVDPRLLRPQKMI